jgi:hypothetical protein
MASLQERSEIICLARFALHEKKISRGANQCTEVQVLLSAMRGVTGLRTATNVLS